MKAKRIIAATLCAAVVAVVPAFAACSSVYVTSIDKTGSNGLEDTYTITYSDGSTSTFSVTNGASSADELIEALWERYNEETGESLTYEQFLELYLSDVSSATAVGDCLLSSMKVYAEFVETESYGIPGMSSSYSYINIYTGGAVIYSMDEDYTYIITNYHVIYDSSADTTKNGGNTPYKVYGYLYGSEGEPTANGRTVVDSNGYVVYDYGDYGIELEYIGGSVTSDVAVLRADTEDVLAINSSAHAVTVADGYSVGDTAIAIGNPNDEGISVTKGIISTVDEYIYLNIDGTMRSYRSIRIDTALYSGNSGGGLFNANGELIGLANAGNTTDQNINYAVPIEIVTGTADSIIYYSVDDNDDTNGAYTLDTGLSFNSKNSKYVYDAVTGKGKIEEDVVVSDVASSSVGARLGIEVDDIITELVVNGTSYAVTRTFTLSDLGLTLRAGDTISFVYKRDGSSNSTSDYTITQSDLTVLE